MHSQRQFRLDNPENIDSIIPYAIYNTHKVVRRQVQNEREKIQHTTSFLERQAKKSVKDLEDKEKSLINFYKLKESRFEEMRMKEENRRRLEKQLQDHRRTNTSFRENSMHRRTAVRQEWENLNRKRANEAKTYRSQSQRKLSEDRQLQKSLLKKRNEAFARALELGNEHSRIRSFYSKRFISSQVKNDLIRVQQNIKNSELQKINTLNQRQQHLLDIVQKSKKKYNHYDHTLTQVKGLAFEEMYPKIKSVTSKKPSSRRGSSRSDSLLI